MKKFIVLTAFSLLSFATAQSSTWTLCDAAKDPKSFPADAQSAVITGRGTGDWLFGTSSFWGYSDPTPDAPYFRRFAEVLKTKGVKLIIVQVPPRGGTETQYLANAAPKGLVPANLARSYTSYVGMFNANDIFSPDLIALYDKSKRIKPFFFERDHHWTPEAATVTAVAINQYLISQGILSQIPETRFTLQKKIAQNNSTFGSRVASICKQPVPAQTYESLIATPVAQQGLLDAEEPAIVLAGTSNSYRSSGAEDSFAAALRYTMQRDVANFAIDGGGPWGSIEKYLYSDVFKAAPTKVLIWEMNNPTPFKAGLTQLIPLVKGPCMNPLAQVKDVLPSQSLLNVKMSPIDYFVIDVTDPAIQTVTTTITDSVGKSWPLSFTHAPKGAISKQFFNEAGSSLTSIKVDLPDSTGKVSITACKG